MFKRIDAVVGKTILSIQQVVAKNMDKSNAPRTGCFELFGFDVMLDADLQAWLIEVKLLNNL